MKSFDKSSFILGMFAGAAAVGVIVVFATPKERPLPVLGISACDAHEITSVKNICICVPSESEQDYIVR